MNYSEALEFIHKRDWRGSKLGLERTIELLDKLGNPERELKFVHIAGTNGKGSVSAMLSSVLTAAGYKTGFYTSPYITRFNERIQINGVPIRDDALAGLITRIKPIAEGMTDTPTEFEIITAAGLEFFRREGCDIVFLEVGLGGELDSTNVIPSPLLAVITNIGLDHTGELGSGISEIAFAKAGIIKKDCDVVFYGENAEAERVIREQCVRTGSRLTLPDFGAIIIKEAFIEKLTFSFGTHRDISIPLTGRYQYKNAALTLCALDILRVKGFVIPEEAVRTGMASVSWPGRFELLMRSPVFISDGGHNPQGVASAVESLDLHFPGRKAVFLLGVMADKDYPRMLGIIAPFASGVVCVKPDNPRALSAGELKKEAEKFGIPAETAASVAEGALRAVTLAGKDGIVFALGSLYMYAEVKAATGMLK